MSKATHIRFKVPPELADMAMKALEVSAETGKIRRGTNEATKAIERSTALIVFIAEDVQPPEVVAHLPLLCEEKNIPYIYVPTRQALGNASGIDISSAAIAIVDAGKASDTIKNVVDKLKELK